MSAVARLKRTKSQNTTNYTNQKLTHELQAITTDSFNIPSVPAGCVMATLCSTDPRGWFICDGRALEVQYYPDLFAVIGYHYGGSGAYFNLPDFQGAFLRGSGSNTVKDAQNVDTTYTGPTLFNMQTHATQDHYHSINDPSHTHPIRDDGGPNQGYPGITSAYDNVAVVNGAALAAYTGITVKEMDNKVISTNPSTVYNKVLTSNTETRPFNYGVNWIIKMSN